VQIPLDPPTRLVRGGDDARREALPVGLSEYEDLHSEVLGLLNLVRNTVSNAANTAQYLR
jgi:hypothetical protein